MCKIQSWLTTAENFKDILLKIILSENVNIWHKRYGSERMHINEDVRKTWTVNVADQK